MTIIVPNDGVVSHYSRQNRNDRVVSDPKRQFLDGARFFLA